MNLRDIEDKLDSREPQPRIEPGLVVLASFGGMALCVLIAVGGLRAAAWVGLPLVTIYILERFSPWGER